MIIAGEAKTLPYSNHITRLRLNFNSKIKNFLLIRRRLAMLKARAMQKMFPVKFRIVFRAALFSVVFVGLLFSCGEGIRLCPFPMAETAQNNPFQLKNSQERNYEKNIHRFENAKANSQLKSQRENRQPYWANVYNALENLSFLGLSDCSEINTTFDSQTFQSRAAFASIRSRAPPIS